MARTKQTRRLRGPVPGRPQGPRSDLLAPPAAPPAELRGLDNRSMIKLTCDCCGQTIEGHELVMVTIMGNDYHMACATKPDVDKASLVNARVLSHPQRMDEYMAMLRRFKPPECDPRTYAQV